MSVLSKSRALRWMTFSLLSGCGGTPRRMPDESADLGPRASAEIPQGLGETEWVWRSASCTEGALDLSARGFAQRLRITEVENGLAMTYDQTFANEGCALTILQSIRRPAAGGELWVEEKARVAMPSRPDCTGVPEAARPGEVRRNAEHLEVLVQRSNWCNGFEVTMRYDRATPQLLTPEELIRRYVLEFNLGDVEKLTTLFADTGSLLEPFTRTETGDPYRHDGRAAVRAWYEETLGGATWRAMRVTSSEPGEAPNTVVVGFEYMDPRLEAPLAGRTTFTIAAGEIFEAHIELTTREPASEG